MRVVYLHQYFRTPQMAGGTRSYEFARRLAERGHEVHVVTSDTTASGDGRRPWRTTREAGATVHWAAVPYDNSMDHGRRIRAFGDFARRAARRAASIDQDVVLASSTPLTIAIPAIYTARRRRVPMVFEVRDLWPETPIALGALRSPILRRLAWRLERAAYTHSREIIALSPTIANSIRTRFPDASVTVVSNGCDTALFADADKRGRELRASLPWLGDRPLILYAGTLGVANGLDYLMHMAASLRTIWPDARVALVGRGAEEERLRHLARELGVLERNLFMLDEVPKSEAVAYFGACSLAVSTVVNSPFMPGDAANKVFDAFAAARPVGVNNTGFLSDLLQRSGAGLALPANEPHRAAAIVAAFLQDPRRVVKAGAAATELATGEYDRDRLFDRFERVLLAAAGQSAGGHTLDDSTGRDVAHHARAGADHRAAADL